MNLAIVTDSTSCLHPSALEEAGIGSVSAKVVVHGRSYKDWLEIQPESVYVALHHGVSVHTQPPDIEDFQKQYEQLLHSHDRIISIHSSLDLSLTLVQANMAAAQIAPSRIRVVDSRSVSGGLAVQVLRAWELVSQGVNEAAVLAELERLSQRSSFFFTLDRLDHLIQGGRLAASVKGFEYLLGLGLILQCRAGAIQPMQTAVQEELLQTLIGAASAPFSKTPVELTVMHSDAALDLLADFNHEIEKNALDIRYMRLLRLSPSVAAHIGEGGLGVHICERFH